MIRLFNHYLSTRLLILTALEASMLFGAVLLLLEVVPGGISPPIGEGLAFTAVMLGSMSAMGLYQQDHTDPFRLMIQRLLIAYGIALVVLALIFTVMPVYVSRKSFMFASMAAVSSVVFLRFLFFRWTHYALPKRRVLVLGNGSEAADITRYLTELGPNSGVEYCGSYPVETEESRHVQGLTVDHTALMSLVLERQIGEIVIAVRERRGGVLPLRQLLDCKLNGVKILDMPGFYERELGQVQLDSLKPSWLIFSEGFDQSLWRDAVKRIFDIAVSIVLMVLTAPLVIVAAAALVLETGFPILYRQERVGLGGKSFHVLKLRSMIKNAEANGKAIWAQKNDHRITRVGAFLRKTRIDELPQIFNVLRGEMSFVGPRPERPMFVKDLTAAVPFYDVRHSVKPGITGWAQVRHEYASSIEDTTVKLQFDLYYVKNHSLFLDLLILVETVQVVLSGKGAR